MSRLRTRLGLMAALLALVAAAAGCGGGDEGGAEGSAGASNSDVSALASFTSVVDGQSATTDGDDLFLEWAAVDGATTYAVTVAHDDGVAWTWVGPDTRVRYGSLPSVDEEATEAIDPDLDLAFELDPSRDHRWFVTAFDADDEVLAVGPIVDLTTD